MNYGYIENGQIIAPVAMCSRFKGVGAWHLLTDEQRAQYGWYPCVVINEGYDAKTQSRSATPDLVFDQTNKVITATYTIVNKSLETIKQEQLAEVASVRYEREVGGVFWNGVNIYTDRESQGKLGIEKAAAFNGDREDGEGWKCRDEMGQLFFRPTTNAEMIDLASKVYQYVRNCFRREDALMTAIKEGTYDESQLTEGWPSNVL